MKTGQKRMAQNGQICCAVAECLALLCTDTAQGAAATLGLGVPSPTTNKELASSTCRMVACLVVCVGGVWLPLRTHHMTRPQSLLALEVLDCVRTVAMYLAGCRPPLGFTHTSWAATL